MKAIAAAIIFTLLPLVGFASDQSVQFPDRYGNLVETRDRRGGETVVRDGYGDITRTERNKGQGRKTIRDKQGESFPFETISLMKTRTENIIKIPFIGPKART